MAESRTVKTEEQMVVFEIGREVYGVDIESVHEIIRMQEITTIPRAPEFVEGVINLRGKVIPVVDLRKRFAMIAGEYTKATRIVVVDIGRSTIGMIVDGVSEVLRIPSDCIEPPSPVVTTLDSDYLRGIAKLEERLIILLDLNRILNSQEQESLQDAA